MAATKLSLQLPPGAVLLGDAAVFSAVIDGEPGVPLLVHFKKGSRVLDTKEVLTCVGGASRKCGR